MDIMQKFIHCHVQSEDLNVSYLDNEKKDLPVLLFIHGNSSSKETFDIQLKYFSKNFRVIAPDLPGHGKSDSLTQSPYSLRVLNEFLINFVKSLDVDIYCMLGHSLGGHIAMQSLNNISPFKIVTWGTPPMTNPPVMEKLFKANSNTAPFFKREASLDELNLLYKDCFEQASSRNFLSFAKNFENTDPRFREELITELGLLKFKDELDELEKFRGEVLFILGENEKIINNEYILKNCFDYYIEVLKNSSHNLHIDSPEKFNFRVLRYLRPNTNENTINLKVNI